MIVNLAYIQARGGSKRFPGKNIALWNGKPMLADAIIKARSTGLFDIIAVSSDDDRILSIAHQYGAIPIWRTPETSNDYATDTQVAQEVLEYFPDVEVVCKLYPCVPLLKFTDINKAYYLMVENELDGIYSIDENCKDAGAFYLFTKQAFDTYGNIALDTFPWKQYYIENACDINTPEDLEIAKQKAGI